MKNLTRANNWINKKMNPEIQKMKLYIQYLRSEAVTYVNYYKIGSNIHFHETGKKTRTVLWGLATRILHVICDKPDEHQILLCVCLVLLQGSQREVRFWVLAMQLGA